MKITDRLFEAFLKCPTKCWLWANNQTPSGNTYAEWVKTQNESYCTAVAKHLLAQTPPTDSVTSPTADNLKGAKWRLAVNIPVTGSIAFAAETRLHAVERVPSEGKGKAAQFIPIRFIFTNKLCKDDKLLLAFDAFVLAAALGRDIAFGKIIHGDNHATIKVKTSALASEIRKRLVP